MIGKRGQVTIFIIIAIVVIAIAVLIYYLNSSTNAETQSRFDEQNPPGFIQACLQDRIEEVTSIISSQGGSFNPEHYILYQDDKIEYLCYTGENYKTCIVQQPLLKLHIETQIKNNIESDVINCFNELKKSYENRGFNTQLVPGSTNVELLPKRVVTTMGYSITITKGETERYNSFSVVLNNNLYELVSISNSIIEWETKIGDAETTIYMNYYRDVKVEKLKQGDGSTIYILTDRNNKNKFQFASRSVVFPGGFGAEGVAIN